MTIWFEPQAVTAAPLSASLLGRGLLRLDWNVSVAAVAAIPLTRPCHSWATEGILCKMLPDRGGTAPRRDQVAGAEGWRICLKAEAECVHQHLFLLEPGTWKCQSEVGFQETYLSLAMPCTHRMDVRSSRVSWGWAWLPGVLVPLAEQRLHCKRKT